MYRSSMLFEHGRMRKECIPFTFELDGKRLTPEQIQVIAHSEAYQDGLLAFNEGSLECHANGLFVRRSGAIGR